MNTFKKIFLLLTTMTTASFATDIVNTDIKTMRTFMSVFQDLEEYRSWTASKLSGLDLRDENGKVNEAARDHMIKNIENGLKFTLLNKKSKNQKLNISCKYLSTCSDRVDDYFISECIYNSFDFIFKNLLASKDFLAPLTIWREDLNAVINGCKTTIDEIRKIAESHDSLDQLPNGYSNVALKGRSQNGKQFFSTLSSKERKILSRLEDSNDQLYCGALLSHILSKLEYLQQHVSQNIEAFKISNSGLNQLLTITTPDSGLNEILRNIISQTGLINREDVLKFSRKVNDSIHEFNGLGDATLYLANGGTVDTKTRLNHKRLISMLTDARFHFDTFESRVQNQVIAYLKMTYKDHFDISENLFGTLNSKQNKKSKTTHNKKSRKKTSHNKKKKSSKKVSVITENTQTSQKEEIINNEKEELFFDAGKCETIPSPTDIADTSSSSDDDLEITFEGEENSFDFNKWYEENVVTYKIKSHGPTEVVFSEDGHNKDNDITPFSLSHKARKFYLSTIGKTSEPVKKQHFKDFLKSVGGVLDESEGNGSRAKYWLPNFSSSRDKSFYLRFGVHLPHSGSEHFPWKTLKDYIYPSLERCDLMPNRFEF